jgi:hypothetical protein
MKRRGLKLQPAVKVQMRLTTRQIVAGTALIVVLSIAAFLYMNLGNNQDVLAATLVNNTATKNGNWNDPTVWSAGRVPAANDNITIPAAIQVNVTSNVSFAASSTVALNVRGNLYFVNTYDIVLGSASELNVFSGGTITSGNGSSRLYIGPTMLVYKGNMGTFTGPTTCTSSGCSDNVSLPITLVSFTAKATAEGVELKWVTAKEENNAFFTIERSADARNFSGVQEIKGAVNSTHLKNYQALDQAAVGTHYYRLRQTDINGTSTVSKMVSVEVKTTAKAADQVAKNFKMYPNPASAGDELNLELGEETAMISLMDKEGNILASQQTDNSPTAQLRLGQITPGLYFVKVQSGSQMNIQRLVVR